MNRNRRDAVGGVGDRRVGDGERSKRSYSDGNSEGSTTILLVNSAIISAHG